MRWAWLTVLFFFCLPVLAADGPPPAPPAAAVDRAEAQRDRAAGGPRKSTMRFTAASPFLLKRQNKDGSWGSANITRPGDIYSPVPGAHHAFKAAVTSMCISALIEIGGDRAEVTACARSRRGLARSSISPRSAAPRPTRSTTSGRTPIRSRP